MNKSAKFSLKLLIDEKTNKVVLAEAGQDFVDVLMSLLTLPMGKVARLLENQKAVLGCYKNLNRSVANMGIDHFETEACKSMLMCPKSTMEIHCSRLKLNMSHTNPTNFFVCPKLFQTTDSCSSRAYSNFNTSRCSCGSLMNAQIPVPEEEQVGEVIGNNADGVLVNCRSSFIVTDDLKVSVNSIGLVMQALNELGYVDCSDLRETLLDVGFEEVLNLLGCLFTSESPLTCAFLRKTCVTRKHLMLSPPATIKGKVCSVKVFVRKLDREILYAECNEDFINSLLSFLVLPLELACSLSNDNTIFGCVGNLCRSPCRRTASGSCRHPYYYIFSNIHLLNYTSQSVPYDCFIPRNYYSYSCYKVARSIERSLSDGGKIVRLHPNDPKVKPGTSSGSGSGFMKKHTKFVVSNDLTITPMNSFSTIGLLKKTQVGSISDLEEYQLSISKPELISILRASLTSSSALTIGLSNLLVKKPKEKT
ncbi:unnamed protein product [Microthlaspi erraticum]|uniref:DUF674 domain-containing protein n=1 Tax=Microthlaspi erraticum TaxID=1685480 RepID=A0A6D2HMI0_9BRAS|nr:unnamed protein product [Microthlaspi erraticum]